MAATAVRISEPRSEAETRGSEAEAALFAAAERLSKLVDEARGLDERLAVVMQREEEIEVLAASVAEARAREVARAAELDERERALAEEQTRLAEQAAQLGWRETSAAELEAELVERAGALEERVGRLRWRWLLRVWSWRPRLLSKQARVCELFFVPTPHGYKLLEQAGVAVTPQARLTGLLDEQNTYAVTKLAQLPFDGRWCAYLEVTDWKRNAK